MSLLSDFINENLTTDEAQRIGLLADNRELKAKILAIADDIADLGGKKFDKVADAIREAVGNSTIHFIDVPFTVPFPMFINDARNLGSFYVNIKNYQAQYNANGVKIKELDPTYEGVKSPVPGKNGLPEDDPEGDAPPPETGLENYFGPGGGSGGNPEDNGGINWLYVAIGIALVITGYLAYKYIK